MQKIIQFVKKETILTAAWVLALFSAILVPPTPSYIEYIDFRSLGILWSLMIIMEGLSSKGFFQTIGQSLLKKTKQIWQLCAVLIFLCFFLSMFITNDVALLTFVPFALYILKQCGRKDLFIPVIVLQTLAANLGSMLTPVGNPQNLYLYGLSGMALIDFMKILLPYSLATFALLCASIFFLKGKTDLVKVETASSPSPVSEDSSPSKCDSPANDSDHSRSGLISGKSIPIYGILFVLALLVVARVLPFGILVLTVLVTVFVMDRKTLISIDYALLFTFLGFFIFTGNLGRIPAVSDLLLAVIVDHEVLMGIGASQFISNVPAALLLSPFTDNYHDLIIGVNLGGLGTLIASMASLISFKSLAHNYNELKGKYFLHFTGMNLLYLAILYVLYLFIR